MWLDKAIKEAPYLRDPYMERALLEYQLQNWNDVIKYILKALEIKTHQKTYINEVFSWNYTPYDLLSIAFFNVGKYNQSLENAKKALEMEPSDERIKRNVEIIKDFINK